MTKRFDTLKDRVKGTYDLDMVDDCHEVINVLLRGSETANKRADEARRQLQALALEVVNRGPLSAGKAAEALRGIDNSEGSHGSKALIAFLGKMASEMQRAEVLSDDDLVSEVVDGLWANLDMHSRESAVLDELVRRFKGGEQETDSAD